MASRLTEFAARLYARVAAQARWRKVTAASIVGIAVVGGVAWGLTPRAADPQASPTVTSSVSAAASPSPAISSVAAELRPGEVIATTTVESLNVYSAPGDASPSSTLGKWSYYGQPLTLLALDAAEVGGVEWLNVLLPVRPNGTTGWIRAGDVATSSTDLSIYVFLDEKVLELRRGEEVLISTAVVIGTDTTPTPTGLYYVTDPLEFVNPGGVYGAYALGLSGFSDVLTSFNGAPPQIAIHGTNDPALLGTAASNGCVRVANDAIVQIASLVGLGTPVFIQDSRDDDA
jgi:lipoprotein-anchoring transpeptidase ErfK/SrfK